MTGLDVVVVAYGDPEPLRACLDALDPRYAPIVVDNSSRADTRAVVVGRGGHYVDPGRNLGFAAGVNVGLAHRSDLEGDVLLLNPDATITFDGLDRLRGALAADPALACVAPGQDDGASEARVAWPEPTPAGMWLQAVGLGARRRSIGFVIGSLLLIRGRALCDVGPFDERFFLYAEETDWQIRARRRGWRIAVCEDVRATHVGAGTGGDPVRRETHFYASHERLVRKYHGALGWQSYRAASVLDAAVRAVLAPVTRRPGARRRLELFLTGPVQAELSLAGGSATDRPLRVAQVVCTDRFAGAERYVVNLARGLGAQGHRVTTIGGDQERMRAALAGSGVQVSPGARFGEAAGALRRLGPFDVVHAHMTAAELAAVMADPLAREPLVSTRHFAQTRGSTPAGHLLGRTLTGRVTAQLAISRYVAERIEGPSVVVHPGTPDRPPTPGGGRRRTVLLLQRLETEKRGDLGIEVFARSRLAELGWTLLVAGEGARRGDLERRAEARGIGPACRFLGARADVDDLLATAGILLAPRPDEPYGLSVVEAMAAGLPVVAADGGGHGETVGVVPGAVVYPPLDVEAAAMGLRALATDDERRAAYGEALRVAHDTVLSLDTQVAATLEVYRQVARGARRGQG